MDSHPPMSTRIPAASELHEKERRLQRRFEVLQAATLKTAAGQAYACEIRNFCLGGLFLKFDGVKTGMPDLTPLGDGEEVEIGFTPPPSIGANSFNLKARLARRDADGVGVAFVGTPIEATRTLNKIAASLRTQRMIGKRYQGMDSQTLQETCRQLLAPVIQDAFTEFFTLIQDRLSAASVQLTNFAERNDMITACDRIRLAEAAVRQVAQQQVLVAFDQFLKRTRPAEKSRERAGLSLVQTEEFEDWLNMTGEVNKLEACFSIELAALEPRIEKLYGRALDRTTNPFGPSVAGHAVKAAFENQPLSLKVRQVVYATMREALVHPLGELYKQLDGILPQADGGRPQAAEDWDDPHALGEVMGLDSGVFEGGDPAPDRSSSAASAGGVAGALMNLFRRAQRASQPATQGRAPDQAGATVSGHAASAPAAPAAGTGVPDGMPPTAGFGQRFEQSSRRVLGELVSRGQILPGFEMAAQGSAEVFGALAETIESEKSLPAPVKHYVRQLEEPLLKLAVLDANFLNSPQHPAHRVLNAVDRLAMVSSDDGKINDHKLLQVIQRWTERIRNEADSNSGIYEEARSQLEKVLRPLMRRRSIHLARLQAGLEGWQRMGQANRSISREFERRIAGREVPDVVLEFFNPGWRNFLIRVQLRQGAGSPEETEAWQAVDRLLEWMTPDLATRPPFSEVQQLLTYIDSRLTLVSAGKEMQESIIERLADGLFHPERGSYRMLAGVSADIRQAEQEPPLAEAEAALLGQFRVGDWLSFAQVSTPLNLIWIGDDPHVYVFCNYKGMRKLELKREELLALLKSGEAQRTDNLDLPLMDRSFSSMIEHMHRNLLKQATYDPETGLIRRSEFMRQARHVWLHLDGEAGGCILGVIDIEDLRIVQAKIGEDAFRNLMQALSRHLEQSCHAGGGVIGRTDERTFAFVRACQSEAMGQELAESFITRINQFGFEWGGETITLTANSGLAWSGTYVEPEILYNRADAACLTAKHEGRNQLVFFRDEDAEHTGHAGLVHWAGRFNSILGSGRLFLRCQPIVALSGEPGQATHYEILLGASSDESEPIPIGDFVAAIERLKRISELDQWVVRTVFDWIRAHPQAFGRIGAFSINLSGQSVTSRSFMSFMEEELGRGDIPGEKLIFEITESAAIDSFAKAEAFIKKFRRYGCRFSLDDFGVGFSSFSYLKNLKVDYLKIDGSFIRDMLRNEVDVALVSSMHETSRFLGIKTIAECVENQETLEQLQTIGVNFAQGYFTGRPLPIDQLVG